MRRANSVDIPLLVSMMTEFYAETNYDLNPTLAAEAFSTILADERLGYIWVIQAEHHDVGYVVLALKFAMEYSGLIACLDDLYVQPNWRNKGLSTAALAELRVLCEKAGIRAVTVEVGLDNGPAQTVYRRIGFTEAADRQLLALALAAPSHIL